MILYDRLRDDLIKSMKAKNGERSNLLRVILGEVNRNTEKDFSDKTVLSAIKKMKKDALLVNSEESQKEIKILDEYLPEQLEEKQLETLIMGIITKNGYDSMKNMGDVMKELQQNYGGKYDGKMASQIVKKSLQK